MRKALSELTARRHFDLVQVESSQMGLGATDCEAPVVLDEHNVEFLLLRRLASIEATRSRRAFGRLEALKSRLSEIESWRDSHGVVFTSDADRAVMQSIVPGKDSCVVPNGVDTEHFHPSALAPERSTIVFTGAINYRPNTDAVAYCIREVMPVLRRRVPSAKLVVVGQGVPDWLVRMADSHVEFTGFVPDVRPHLARAAVVVAPLRAGSGTRLKILEAMAMAKPVVTTAIGCEGLDVTDGQHLCVEDEPHAFAQRIARLMSDPDEAEALGLRARSLVEHEYSWTVAVTRLEEFHSTLVRNLRRAA
jgi:glycosyltransferase involved in cell wall biosynthesis